jgi:peptidoglycan hydrolase-like protein with peptidoglycan-binding domain
MPWMQRLTWTGIALHESDDVPGFPASHGCVRMPKGFAEELYSITDAGEHVIITGDEISPVPISHALLPTLVPPPQPIDHWRLRFHTGAAMFPLPPISSAAMLAPLRNAGPAGARYSAPLPVRILITRGTRADTVANIQSLLSLLEYYKGPVDGAAGRLTLAAVERFRVENGLTRGIAMDDAFVAALHEKAGAPPPNNGHIYVRRNFAPLFDAPIGVDNPEQPLGTHLLVASSDGDASVRWSATTLENQLTSYQQSLFGIARGLPPSHDAAAALDRIRIPEKLRNRIAALLEPGVSIAISDTGASSLTGWRTDFVILTRTEEMASAQLLAPPARKAPSKPAVKRMVKQQTDPGKLTERALTRQQLMQLLFGWPER